MRLGLTLRGCSPSLICVNPAAHLWITITPPRLGPFHGLNVEGSNPFARSIFDCRGFLTTVRLKSGVGRLWPRQRQGVERSNSHFENTR